VFYRLPERIAEKHTNSYLFLQRLILSSILLAAVFSTACGHSVKESTTTSNSGNPSTSDLSVSASLPKGSVGSGYNGAVTASGGTVPYSFNVTSGQLPSGVLLNNSTGKLSGTPSGSGAFNFSVTVSDFQGKSKEKLLQIAVADNSTSNGGSSGSGSSGSGSGSGGSSGGSGSSGGGSSNGGNSEQGKSFSTLQRASGWGQFGQGPPNFVDCSPSPCNGTSFSMTQNVSSPSLSGSATIFNVGGSTPYSDALWNNHLIGPFSSQGTFDEDRTLVPTLSEFTYDVDFYTDSVGLSEALEFDVNQFFDGMGFIYGHECRILAGNEWAVWDNANAKWVSTGISCYPNQNAWNHVTLKVQRTSDNHLTYKSISLNGDTHELNWTFEHGSAPGWYGVVLNFQMDGDFKQDSYNVYLDNLKVTYQ
jgi:Putative Ig domain